MDIIVGADGEAAAVERAHAAARQRFSCLLAELVEELPGLRAPVDGPCRLRGVVARRMWQAAYPFRDLYVTPMVAVAGAVAQELLACYQGPGVARAWVNNGGDIALHLTPGARFRVGLCADVERWRQVASGAELTMDGWIDLDWDSPVRGVATSGWKGRSFSLGIADSVTVLAASAAEADAAATMIANAVDVSDAAIVRKRASSLRDDTDLGDLPVTVHVPPLAPEQVQAALAAGRRRAEALQQAQRIVACVLSCQGRVASTENTAGERSFFPSAQPAHQPGRPVLQEIA